MGSCSGRLETYNDNGKYMVYYWARGQKEKAQSRRPTHGIPVLQIPEFYYWARHAVDDNNHNRSGYLSLEDAVNTKSWVMRQFTFIEAVAEANACLAYNYFVRRPKKLRLLTNTEFRRLVAESLVTNTDGRNDAVLNSAAYENLNVCTLQRYPKGTGEWSSTKGSFKVPSHPYQKFRWNYGGDACKRLVRTYCSCDPKLTMCNICFGHHLAERKSTSPSILSPASDSSTSAELAV